MPLQGQSDVPLPPGSKWILLTDGLIAAEREKWIQLIDGFDPGPSEAGGTAVKWLRDAVCSGTITLNTQVLCTDHKLLGFYSVEHALVDLTPRNWPLVELRRKLFGQQSEPQPGLIISSIVRSHSEPSGFGRNLVNHAIGLALSNPEIVALFVSPANPKVARLWQDRYSFRIEHEADPSTNEMLWLPVNPAPEAQWP
jgi:ribosomal protein S18 acetylase RimI-like enzyme